MVACRSRDATSHCTPARRPPDEWPVRQEKRRVLAEFLDVGAEQLAQLLEARLLLQVFADVFQRAGDVLDVDGVAPGGRLVAEGPERLQVALQRHHVEA